VAVKHDGGEHRIKSYHVDETIKQINQSGYGAHHLIIYPDLSAKATVQKIYQNAIRT
jgi:ppGpp synthetase/RelA/SpoT-type nucleotidyltranferase